MVADAGHLVLVRHGPTVPQSGVRSAQWLLASNARALSAELAALLAERYPVDVVVTSHEPKAVGTGRALAAGLGARMLVGADLEEHHRDRTVLMPEADWHRTIKRFFENPSVLLFGQETGDEARRRFERGLRAAQAEQTGKRLAVVSHATVITLLLAERNDLAPFEFWRTLRMPEALVVEADSLRLVDRLAPAVS